MQSRTITLSDYVWQQIDALAAREGRPTGDWLSLAVETRLSQKLATERENQRVAAEREAARLAAIQDIQSGGLRFR